jgi:hypothetical protein
MAVPKSKRGISRMQYIESTKKLACAIFRYSNTLPKRYAFRMANPLVEHAFEALYEVKAANSTYVKDYDSYLARRAHLKIAQTHLDHVETLLDVLYDVVEKKSEHQFVTFAQMLEECKKLISGVMKKDTDAYNKAAKQE